MRRVLLWVMVACTAVWSYATLTPVAQIEINATTAKDLSIKGDDIVVATDNGRIEIFDKTTYKRKLVVEIPEITDFTGDTVPARVMSADEEAGRFLILSDSGKMGYSDLYLYEAGKLTKLLGADDKKALIKARFVDKDHIFLGYLSDEVSLLDVKTKQERYRVQLSESKFSDFAFNDDRTQAVVSCESGELTIVEVASGKILERLKGQNVDNVYKVDFKRHLISAAGQDRRGAIYDVRTGKGRHIKADFLIYATALSPSARMVIFATDENNGMSLYDTQTLEKKAYLKGQKSTLNTIRFIDETTIVSASDDHTVMVWKLK